MDPMFQEGPNPGPLGDVKGSRSDPVNWWEKRFGTEQIHCIVQLHSKDPVVLDEATKEVLYLAVQHGVTELLPRREQDHQGSYRLDGQALIGGQPQAPEQPSIRGRVHFGYIDGFSRPNVSWSGEPGANQLHFRHFLLGYSTPEVFSAPRTGPACDLFRDSSYMLLRWLYQDVAAFNRFLREAAPKVTPHLPSDQAQKLVAAKLMGRWRNGTPLALSPDHPLPLHTFSNDFAYQTQDPQGQKCPFSAHIRVTNPRDEPLNNVLAPEGVPSVIRRGIPYGPEMAPGQTTDDGIDRGILGIFLCSNIRRQFYTLTHWIAENSFSPVFKGEKPSQDALFGNRSNSATSHNFLIPQANGDVTLALPDLVHTKGTAFFLLPSISALQLLTR
jgi:deferrochelatase/peroxidase EfeB